MKKTKTPHNSLCCKHTVRQLLTMVFAMALFIAGTFPNTYAAENSKVTKLENSDFYKGLLELLQDLSLAVTFIGPAICIICAGVFLARRSMADEQEGKMWNKRIATALICAVSIGLVSGIVTLIVSYF